MFDKRFHIKRKPYKIYGNEKTALELSEKAQRMLSVTDPIEIREYTDADENKHYDIYGVIECLRAM